MEQASTLASRRLGFAAWTTASIDSFSFRSSALPGDAIYFRSCITKVFESSVECYVVAMGGTQPLTPDGSSHLQTDISFPYPNTEDRFALETKLVPVGDAFFTLVRPSAPIWRFKTHLLLLERLHLIR